MSAPLGKGREAGAVWAPQAPEGSDSAGRPKGAGAAGCAGRRGEICVLGRRGGGGISRLTHHPYTGWVDTRPGRRRCKGHMGPAASPTGRYDHLLARAPRMGVLRFQPWRSRR